MTDKERHEKHLEDLYEVAERHRRDIGWVLEVEDVTEHSVDGVCEDEKGNLYLMDGAIDEAEKYLAWEIADALCWLDSYEEVQKDYESYRHMVEVESRDW